MTVRAEKMKELLRQLSSRYISERLPLESLVTVTKTTVSRDFKGATIFVTVLPDDQEESVLSQLRKNLSGLREFIGKNIEMKTLPYLSVEIDEGEKHRQKIDQLGDLT